MSTARNTRNQPYQRPRRSDLSAAQLDTIASADGRVNRLVVSGLHYEITEADLVKIFKPYGTFTRNPTIRYDRSGRSTGFAFVNYESQENANLAKRELDGVIAKGEPIRIVIESFIPRNPAPKDDDASSSTRAGHTSLKDRLGRTPLIHRLTDDGNATSAAQEEANTHGPGPTRNRRGAASDGGRRRAVSEKGPRRDGGGKAPRGQAKAKTAEDLDKELEAYVSTGSAVLATDMAATAAVSEDMDMAP
ncbi:hypothetical protein FRB95_007426 [Tulasnella sp. JGI-2019a]|nr:hypothetical protein FRB95_007426 [Tulasnella sp. JGI-2019a]